ncbi:Rieske (2Fe-2S) protein [Terrabacter sp. BE26]|uniref:Rieske (2Fe-2S) protein n=1 Tax=Terrabacter sp. BE26 TaxID=2898152 RepID=UPI0035BE518F
MTEQQSSGSPSDEGLAERVAGFTDRRGVLKLAGVAAGAGVLAACSSPPVPSGGGGASPAGGAGGAGADGIPTSEIPVGGGKVFPDSKTVVTQPTAGTFKAFDAICPHQGCTVGSVEGGKIICPCHQSHFDDNTGDVVSGPAPTGLTPKTVKVSGSTLTVS